MHRRTATTRAFTLIEVLATLVLVGVVLPVAMRGITLSLQTGGRARHTLEAAQLAQQKIAEALVIRDLATIGNSGDFGAAWPEYRWDAQSIAGDFGVYELTIRVYWKERLGERSLQMSTLIYPLSTATADVGAIEAVQEEAQ